MEPPATTGDIWQPLVFPTKKTWDFTGPLDISHLRRPALLCLSGGGLTTARPVQGIQEL